MSEVLDVDAGSDEYLKSLSGETLDTMARIARAAIDKSSSSSASSPLANPQTFTRPIAHSRLDKSSRSLREGYQHLQKEPTIARIIYADESGEEHTLFISRGITVTDIDFKMANLRAPLGSLASQDVGDPKEIELPGGAQECTLIGISFLGSTGNPVGRG